MTTLVLLALLGGDGLHEAAYRNDLSAVERILKAGVSPDETNRYGVTALHLAITNGNVGLVKRLLEAGASAKLAIAGGEAPLMTAARVGKIEIVDALLAKGADVNASEPAKGQTALMWAAAAGHAAVVERLIEKGAYYRTRLDSGFTPFLFAVREGRVEVVRSLLKAGVSVNDAILPAPDRKPHRGYRLGAAPRAGASALELAVLSAHYELAAVLLDAGANPNAMGSGWTALHAITGVRKPGQGDNDPAPIGSGAMTSLELVRKLKEKGADLNARMTKKIGVGMTSLNTQGATPFFLAARAADAELMQLLADLGADPKIPNVDGSTPLMAAAGLGTRSPGEDAGTDAEVVAAVALALDLGNDIDAVDRNGETAMHGAAYKNVPGAVELLARRGAKREIWDRPNKKGWTPLRIAEGYRFGNFKPSAVTVAAFHKVMAAEIH